MRLDHVLQRARLATILGFYLRRQHLYGLVGNDQRYAELEAALSKYEAGGMDLATERLVYVVTMAGQPQAPVRIRDTEIRILTASDFAAVGLPMSDVGAQAPLPFDS
jgi:DNA phosphorothioation-dependent restriction protein DptH